MADILDKPAMRDKVRELMGLLERETFVEFLTWVSARWGQLDQHQETIGAIVDLYLEEKHGQTRQS